MNAADDRAAAHAQRLQARRALAEADTAVARLKETRERAGTLLRQSAGKARGPVEPDDASSGKPADALGRRMRQIEDRMQETDTRMRIAEADAARIENDSREHESRKDERRDEDADTTSSPERRR